MDYGLNYAINEKLHVHCVVDYNFEVEVEIVGILPISYASKYEDILRLYFNSLNVTENINVKDFYEKNKYIYLCKVLTATDFLEINQEIILADSLIDPLNSYYINDNFTIIIDVDYNIKNTTFRYRQDLINKIKEFLDGEYVESEIRIDKTQEEKDRENLINYSELINKLKELTDCEEIIDKLKEIDVDSIRQEFNNEKLGLIEIINSVINKLKEE